jgi:hypothetical protein
MRDELLGRLVLPTSGLDQKYKGPRCHLIDTSVKEKQT